MNNKKAHWIIWSFTIAVFALVIILHEMPGAESAPAFTAFQPMLHAIINGTCFILLLASLFAVKSKNIPLHKGLNTLAMILSLVFLLSYVVYHHFTGDTSYGGDYRGLYLFILLTHIPLAGLSLPFILYAYYFGMTNQIGQHKTLVRYTYPVWLYVTLTGVLVYVFLAPYYGA
ncbi:DUF420 domain-containing protein [bacterium SCSIO 12741]|nr:DUF420 domain-containing protein [bacterium SCSIO 12741]